ncbi:hypothetical protein VNO80_14561 [Phaseolus coccineus]|uniref:Uncharacterized protein n=1 Tax=Phaseolus coccineus TaxID=3886 RepID=A0AAN9R105_PHACN
METIGFLTDEVDVKKKMNFLFMDLIHNPSLYKLSQKEFLSIFHFFFTSEIRLTAVILKSGSELEEIIRRL